MKKNDLQELKRLDEKALTVKVIELKGTLTEVVMDKNMSKLKDLKSPMKLKRDIARYLTILGQKQMIRELSDVSNQLSDEESNQRKEKSDS